MVAPWDLIQGQKSTTAQQDGVRDLDLGRVAVPLPPAGSPRISSAQSHPLHVFGIITPVPPYSTTVPVHRARESLGEVPPPNLAFAANPRVWPDQRLAHFHDPHATWSRNKAWTRHPVTQTMCMLPRLISCCCTAHRSGGHTLTVLCLEDFWGCGVTSTTQSSDDAQGRRVFRVCSGNSPIFRPDQRVQSFLRLHLPDSPVRMSGVTFSQV